MNPKIYINPEGVACYIADCPEEPQVCMDYVINSCLYDVCICHDKLKAYERMIAAAKQSAVPFIAGSLCKIGGLENAESGTFHPFPSGCKVEILHGQPCLRCNRDCYNHQMGDCKNQVAVLSLIEQEKPKGLYGKYIIQKSNGKPIDPEAEFFVLRLDPFGEMNHIKACRKAVQVYANEIEPFIPELAKDLKERYPIESTEQESQEELWYSVHETIRMCKQRQRKRSIPDLMKKFTITRKSDNK